MKRRVVLVAAAAMVWVPAVSYLTYRLNVSNSGPLIALVRDLVGVVFVVAGLVAWQARGRSRVGPLMILAGAFWFVIDINVLRTSGVASDLLYTAVTCLKFVFIILVGHVLLTFPSGRAENRADGRVLLSLYGVGAALQLSYMLTAGSRPIDCRDCPANLLLLWPNGQLGDLIVHGGEVVTVIAALTILTRVVVHWRRSSAVGRRALAPVLWSIGPIVVTAVVIQLFSASLPGPHTQPIFALGPVVYAALPIALLVGLLQTRLDRSKVGQLVVELSGVEHPVISREAMAQALHDPSVQLIHWSAERDTYVDVNSNPVQLPTEESGRGVTLLERNGEPIGAILHDPLLGEQPELVKPVAAAAQLAVENEHLAAQLQLQLREVEASRARLMTASDEERRRLEHDLHDGAQQRLLTLSFALKLASRIARQQPGEELQQALVKAEEQLTLALAELRELAHGIRPPALTQDGLGPALESLAERSVVPVTIACTPARRFEQPVEATAYFLVSEALANTDKHARATQATVRAWEEGADLVVEVTDDGIGGADPARGAGIRGLMDRVATVRGHLDVDSRPGSGTRLIARLPCE